MSNKYRWLTELSQQFLEKDYLLPGQTVDERVDIICNRAQEILGIEGFASKFKEYFQKGYYSFSTPIWTNFGTDRGLPISCYSSFISDDMAGILETQAEVGIMTKYGGGTSGYFGELRGRGTPIRDNGESSGAVHFMQGFDTMINLVSQGKTRRGQFAAYLPIDHPDIKEFLTIRTEGSPIQDLSYGVCVPDYWMEAMIAGDKEKREIWAKVLATRANTGYPYIFFTDNSNSQKPDVYKDKDMKIYNSNLCNEIQLSSGPDESYVCCLASTNVLYYDEWKNTDAVKYLTYFLDAVMTDFIEKASKIKFMERAVKFAVNQRALGIGWFGWHSYLQSKSIAFDSYEAVQHTGKIAKDIQEQAYTASKELAELYGEPELLKGYGRRNTTLLAIAPTKSSAFIIGQASEGIEPNKSNYMIKDLQKGKFTIKNQYLEKLLDELGKNDDNTWSDILKHGGSVQHLEFLSKHEKNVFKTFSEISQKQVIVQASVRQKYIDQGQSINLMIHPSISVKDVNALMIDAWKLKLKGLYYQLSANASQQFARNILNCSSCEG